MLFSNGNKQHTHNVRIVPIIHRNGTRNQRKHPQRDPRPRTEATRNDCSDTRRAPQGKQRQHTHLMQQRTRKIPTCNLGSSTPHRTDTRRTVLPLPRPLEAGYSTVCFPCGFYYVPRKGGAGIPRGSCCCVGTQNELERRVSSRSG